MKLKTCRAVGFLALGVAVFPVVQANPASASGVLGQNPPVAAGAWTYGKSVLFQSAPTFSSGNTVYVTSLTPQVCQVPPGSTSELELVDVGHCKVTLNEAGNNAYAPFQQTISPLVGPAPLVVTYEDERRASDRERSAFTADFDGLVGDDSARDFTVTPGVVPAVGLPPGRYPVTPTTTSPRSASGAPRYTLTFRPGTLTIDPVIKTDNSDVGSGAHITVDGHDWGSRYVFPYGTQATYTAWGMVPTVSYPYYQFGRPVSGTVTTDQEIDYQTFWQWVSDAPFLDFSKWDIVERWLDVETYLDPMTVNQDRLEANLTATKVAVQAAVNYNPTPAARAAGEQLISYLRLVAADNNLAGIV